jgi:hypothetical protein
MILLFLIPSGLLTYKNVGYFSKAFSAAVEMSR